ncbi:hypothetical protein FRB99_005527 [Tulasnella sp. 403]|nr:hypothetical protein FRB99_005527 [Tulasnella sp. 403]
MVSGIPSILFILSYVAAAAAFIFVTLSLASGLLWLAELIEENTRTAKTIGMRLTYAIMVLHVALWFSDSLPIELVSFSIFCHIVYLQNFSVNWPTISLTSWSFLASCVLVVADHFLWFFHFAHKTNELRRRGGINRPPYTHNTHLNQPHTFMEIASFFGTCKCPSSLVIQRLIFSRSLSANDNALPTRGDASMPSTPTAPSIDVSQKSPRRLSMFPRQSLFKTIFDPVFDLLSALRLRRRRRSDEGIIAPRTPNRSPRMSSTPLTPTGVGLGFFPSDGQTVTTPLEGFRGPVTRLKQPPPTRRVTTDSIPRSPQLSGDFSPNGGSVSPGGLRPRKLRPDESSRPSTPSALAND